MIDPGLDSQSAAPDIDHRVLVDSIGRFIDTLDGQQAQIDHLREQLVSLLDTVGDGRSHDGTGIGYRRSHTSPPQPARQGVAAYCLGTFEFVLGGRRIDGWKPGKPMALLLYLLNHRNHAVGRDVLAEAVWRDCEILSPCNSLKVAMHGLRQTLSTAACDPLVSITACGSGYQLNAPSLWLDVEEFERCYVSGRHVASSGRTTEALRYFTRAAELYRGDFLEEAEEEWIIFRREGLKD